MPGEITTLMEVDDDGEWLEMIDGTRYQVTPGDSVTSILWLPTSEVEIVPSKGDFWTHTITHRGNGQKVRATLGDHPDDAI
jgi:hypothetical protein